MWLWVKTDWIPFWSRFTRVLDLAFDPWPCFAHGPREALFARPSGGRWRCAAFLAADRHEALARIRANSSLLLLVRFSWVGFPGLPGFRLGFLVSWFGFLGLVPLGLLIPCFAICLVSSGFVSFGFPSRANKLLVLIFFADPDFCRCVRSSGPAGGFGGSWPYPEIRGSCCGGMLQNAFRCVCSTGKNMVQQILILLTVLCLM